MARIAGILGRKDRKEVERIIAVMHGEGRQTAIIEGAGFTMGVLRPPSGKKPVVDRTSIKAVFDGRTAPPRDIPFFPHEPFAGAGWESSLGFFLCRDRFGVAPLYYAQKKKVLYFASEVKGLLGLSREIREFPPGSFYSSTGGWTTRKEPDIPLIAAEAAKIAVSLKSRFIHAVKSLSADGTRGCWLSGGLDSSAIAALLTQIRGRIHTFSIGIPGAPDLAFAAAAASYLGTDHHEKSVEIKDLLAVLDRVIYRLESFDALLVRSTLTNYLLAFFAAETVPAVFSGEGGDEMFAGYAYLKNLPGPLLRREVAELPYRLHNTALQRIDRSAESAGLTVHLPFLSPVVADYARSIPMSLKLHRGEGHPAVEKWILRQALTGLLPDSILRRPKTKFWEGTGLGERLLEYAEKKIPAADFSKEKKLPDGSVLGSREELLYYRIFREHFGDVDLSFVGRTREKGSKA